MTAAHCLPHFPPSASISYVSERTYRVLLGELHEEPNVWTECLFVDPVADVAVLGSPDNQELFEEAGVYEILIQRKEPLLVAEHEKVTSGWLLSLQGHWFEYSLVIGGAISIVKAADRIVGGMSGSPILNDDGMAMGILCSGSSSGTPSVANPRLTHALPGWLLKEIRQVGSARQQLEPSNRQA